MLVIVLLLVLAMPASATKPPPPPTPYLNVSWDYAPDNGGGFTYYYPTHDVTVAGYKGYKLVYRLDYHDYTGTAQQVSTSQMLKTAVQQILTIPPTSARLEWSVLYPCVAAGATDAASYKATEQISVLDSHGKGVVLTRDFYCRLNRVAL